MNEQKQEAEESIFKTWAIVELLGRNVYAGLVSEANLFGTTMCRVDIPAVGEMPGFTKYFGGSTIYAITPVDETAARLRAKKEKQQPFTRWELSDILEKVTKQKQLGFDSDENNIDTQVDDYLDDPEDDFPI